MKNEFVTAIAQLSAEKNLNADTVFEAVEAAMASAYKKDDLQYAEIEVKIDRDSGDITSWRLYTVMDDDEIEDDEIQVSPARAKEMGHPNAKVGDVIKRAPRREPERRAASPRRPPSRSSCSACARRSASPSSRTSPARKASWSPAPSSASRAAAAR